MFDDESELRRFLLAGKRGSTSAAYESLGMSKASYYRAIDWIVGCVMSAKRRDNDLQKMVHDQVVAERTTHLLDLVLKHPTWGNQRFAKELSLSYATRVTSNMVANHLLSLCLKTRRERIAKLMEAVIGGQLSELSVEQMGAIAEVNPLVNDASLCRGEDELSVGVTLIPAFDLLGPHWYLQLFVELGSLFSFGRFIQKTQDADKNIRIGRQNELDLALLKSMTNRQSCRVYWATRMRSRYSGSTYRPLFGLDKSIEFCRKSTPPAGLAMIRSRIREEWLLSQSPTVDTGGAALRGSLHAWFSAHNASPTENVFPTQGRAPADMLGLIGDQVNSYLARVVSSEQ